MPSFSSVSSAGVKLGAALSLEVTALSPQGTGVAWVEEQPVWIAGALPGDRIHAVVTRKRPARVEARLLKLEQPAPNRTLPRCRHFGPCGGCALQHLEYPAQVDWKRKMLERIFTQELDLRRLPSLEVFTGDSPWGYRSKMEFTFAQEGDRVTLGLHQRASFQRIVDLTDCEIAPPSVNQLLVAVKEAAALSGLRAYNPKTHQGFWRYAVVRCSRTTGDLLLLLVTHEGPQEALEPMARSLPEKVPSLKSLYWGVSAKVSDVSTPERITFLGGQETLEDQVGGVRFRIGPTQFVQPNLGLASKVYEMIRRQARLTGQETVYDLYSGGGLIALSLAREARLVYGVESEQANVGFAEKNAEINGISNAVFLWGNLEDLIREQALFRLSPKPDVVVLDPPRVGLHAQVCGPLLEARAPTLLYLSCNPLSLTRDLKILLQRDPGYQVESVQLFDFFPHTPHSEVLVTLRG